jgi:hypothetical protein
MRPQCIVQLNTISSTQPHRRSSLLQDELIQKLIRTTTSPFDTLHSINHWNPSVYSLLTPITTQPLYVSNTHTHTHTHIHPFVHSNHTIKKFISFCCLLIITFTNFCRIRTSAKEKRELQLLAYFGALGQGVDYSLMNHTYKIHFRNLRICFMTNEVHFLKIHSQCTGESNIIIIINNSKSFHETVD